MINNNKKIFLSTDAVIILLSELSFLFCSLRSFNFALDKTLRMYKLELTELEPIEFDGNINFVSNNYMLIFILLTCSILIFKYRAKFINIPLILYGVYAFFGYVLSPDASISVKTFLSSILNITWIFCFLYGTRISVLDKKYYDFFVQSFVIVVVFPLLCYVLLKYIRIGIIDKNYISDSIFPIVVYFPFVLHFNSYKNFMLRIIKIGLIGGYVLLCCISLKRSVIISTALTLSSYYLIINSDDIFKKIANQLAKLYFWVGLVVFIILGQFIYNRYYESIAYRFQESSFFTGSGRDLIYEKLLTSFGESGILAQFFGHGHKAVLEITNEKLAHNDFLQILYDYGILGVSLYILVILSIVFLILRAYKNHCEKEMLAVFVSAFVHYLVLGSINCFIYSSVLICPIMLIQGLLWGKFESMKSVPTVEAQ